MAVPTLIIHRNLMPYEDGSGSQYKISLTEVDGEREIRLDDVSAAVSFPMEHWPTIRDTIEQLLAFAAQEPRK